ncbi:hypothetical protein MCERE10_02667 [Burkholderiaceae bacterium]
MFAADFETDLTTAGLPEASPALASGLAADLLFLAGTGAALAAGLTAGLATGLVASLDAGLTIDLATGLALVLTDTEADLELDLAVGLTAALGLGDAAAMVFLMPTDRVISVLFCMECACGTSLPNKRLGCVNLYFNRISALCWLRLPQLDG